jgi:Rrf2 family transcriptional regulator, iron-sulfur cluster assembly transcription factor
MNFSKTASYSLNVLSFMATNEDINMSATYLHEKLSIPYPYLRQVLTSLSKSGFIHSLKGRNGGFSFSKDKKEISLADIIEATDGLDTLNKCILGFRECPFNDECSMHSVWEATRNNILTILKETSLADLVRKRNDI